MGKGQRVGIMAGSGVGKSVLLGMMCKYTEAEIVVVGLIGERGREVGSFVKNILSGNAKTKTVVVAVPADRSPLLRIEEPTEQPQLQNILDRRERMSYLLWTL